ncbi:hypothetical protein RFI_07308 [Reticulomyxa filosa]|uniref:Uncharacterized protein n=1 Tax=Reticulomyxa filosa TaxID=46433 RepID=X6NV95_RETFI|nr:hypothetical protein RFI_07308 [Reticulomyxa filosa]|eukprot:ETO29813.1 hypothetical protein RFI_07308 [Reticulomyxa filosa]
MSYWLKQQIDHILLKHEAKKEKWRCWYALVATLLSKRQYQRIHSSYHWHLIGKSICAKDTLFYWRKAFKKKFSKDCLPSILKESERRYCIRRQKAATHIVLWYRHCVKKHKLIQHCKRLCKLLQINKKLLFGKVWSHWKTLQVQQMSKYFELTLQMKQIRLVKLFKRWYFNYLWKISINCKQQRQIYLNQLLNQKHIRAQTVQQYFKMFFVRKIYLKWKKTTEQLTLTNEQPAELVMDDILLDDFPEIQESEYLIDSNFIDEDMEPLKKPVCPTAFVYQIKNKECDKKKERAILGYAHENILKASLSKDGNILIPSYLPMISKSPLSNCKSNDIPNDSSARQRLGSSINNSFNSSDDNVHDSLQQDDIENGMSADPDDQCDKESKKHATESSQGWKFKDPTTAKAWLKRAKKFQTKKD